MSTLNSLISSLTQGMRLPNDEGVSDLLTAVDSAINTVNSAIPPLASVAEAKAGTLATKSVTPADLAQAPGSMGTGVVKPCFPIYYRLVPAAASATGVLAATALTAEAQQITANITALTYPRVLTVKGNQAGVAGNVVIHGTNAKGAVITETIALNDGNEVAGAKAFATVTQIDLPVEVNAGTDTVSVGFGKVIGLPHCLPIAGAVLVKLFNGSADAGTLAVDAANIESNTYAIAGVPDAAKALDILYLA